jgi:hypothetical protein
VDEASADPGVILSLRNDLARSGSELLAMTMPMHADPSGLKCLRMTTVKEIG